METKDALLHAINEEFVEAVEVLLDHEETIHKPGELHVSFFFSYYLLVTFPEFKTKIIPIYIESLLFADFGGMKSHELQNRKLQEPSYLGLDVP